MRDALNRRSSDPPSADARAAGRPRSETVDAAILRATFDLLSEVGLAGTTINAVARRSGVARASIYLRYPGREALLTATIRAAIGRGPLELSGDLVNDFHRGAEQIRAVLSSPPFRAVLPMLIGGLLAPRPRAITYQMLAPNRSLLVDEFRQLAATAGMRSDVDPEMAVNAVIGGLLNHLLVTGEPPTTADADQILDIVLNGLRLPKGRGR